MVLKKLQIIKEVKEAQRRVKAVHSCPTCLEHLRLIKEHTEKDHQ